MIDIEAIRTAAMTRAKEAKAAIVKNAPPPRTIAYIQLRIDCGTFGKTPIELQKGLRRVLSWMAVRIAEGHGIPRELRDVDGTVVGWSRVDVEVSDAKAQHYMESLWEIHDEEGETKP